MAKLQRVNKMVLSYKQFNESIKPGTYSGIKLSESHAQDLFLLMTSSGVPGALTTKDYHVTLLYSRKYLPHYVADSELRHIATPLCLDVWTDRENKKVLVLKLNAPSLCARHEELMNKHQATYDYPDYTPHVTMSYDIGDFDINQIDISKIPQLIMLCNEYKEDLNDL